MMTHSTPKRRHEDLRVEEFQGELLVYDLRNHRAHSLNGAAAAIWQACDGTTSVTELAERVRGTTQLAVDEDVVWQALVDLENASLLDAPLEREPADPSRRRALAQLGWAAAIPLVLSVTIPHPAYAQTGPTGPTGPTGAGVEVLAPAGPTGATPLG